MKSMVVYEDNHGAVSYWDNYDAAKEEALKIIHDMYSEYPEDEIFGNEVYIDEIRLNQSWI